MRKRKINENWKETFDRCCIDFLGLLKNTSSAFGANPKAPETSSVNISLSAST